MPFSHATWTTVRETNAAVVLEAIRRDPPLSRAEAARRTGMSKPTAGSALDLLLAGGLVREVPSADTPHYRAVYFEPVCDVAYVLGLDIGRRFVRGVLADLSGALLNRHDIRIPDTTPGSVLAAAARIRDEIARDLPVELVVAGVPGVVDPEGVLHESNPYSLEGLAIAGRLGAMLGLPVLVENDINLAALGERAAGHGRGVADFAFLSIGTGVGAGLVLDGRLHRGHRGAAGEVDNPPPGSEGAPDSPSADALVDWSADWIREESGTALTLPVTPEAVFEAAREGDALAVRILDEQARRITLRIAEITRVVDVELIVLGGGIALASAQILPRIETMLAGLLTYPPRVSISALGDAPVLVGAVAHGAELAWQQIASRRIAHAAAVRTMQQQ
ncbi:ROK family protein [Planotetraspora sp. GP83]|uniref:ROK family protein n=1 Tax=Planotetraspora sp. GP83 TaxID=3156264 RepID=UPI0035160DD9